SRAGERIGLLVVGFGQAAADATVQTDAADSADAFLTALELFRLRESQQLERDVRQLMKEFAESLAATLNLGARNRPTSRTRGSRWRSARVDRKRRRDRQSSRTCSRARAAIE